MKFNFKFGKKMSDEKKQKVLKRSTQLYAFGMTLALTHLAYAAGGSPQSMITGAIDQVQGILNIVAPSYGALVFGIKGSQYKLADTHKKVELKNSMIATGIVVILILSAPALFKWVASLAM